MNLQVQLTLLTAIVKLFLKKPSETQELVQQVLSLATQVSSGPSVGLRPRSLRLTPLLLRRTPTTPTCATAATSTGACCPPTR